MFYNDDAELLFVPEGKLVAHTVPVSREQVLEGIEIARDSWEMLVVDMLSVDDIDVPGVHFIDEVYRLTIKKERQFMLINVGDKVINILQLFRLDKKFPIGLNKTSAQLEEEEENWEEEK